MHTMFRTTWLALLASAGLALLACGDDDGGQNDTTANPSFDNWGCNRKLCDWKTLDGSIDKTSTWHKLDLAVSLLESNTLISQVLDLNEKKAPCIVFDTLSDVGEEAFVSIRLDFNDDGIVDTTQQVSPLRWQSLPWVVRAPVAYDSMRLSILKEGEGRAVLAQMRMVVRSECPGEPLRLENASVCSRGDVCKSGFCSAGYCQACLAPPCVSTPAPKPPDAGSADAGIPSVLIPVTSLTPDAGSE